jgi:hypothetical protein
MSQLLGACGGSDTPIGRAAIDQVDGVIDQAVRSEHEADLFMAELRSGARDFTWYVRDNLSGILANQWDQLRDLAFEGSTDFIPALHALGLPAFGWSGAAMQSTLIAQAESTRAGQPKTQQEALDKDPEEDRREQQRIIAEGQEKQQAQQT